MAKTKYPGAPVYGPGEKPEEDPVIFGISEMPQPDVFEFPGYEAAPGEEGAISGPELEVAQGITTPPGGTLTDAENRYLAEKYGGPEAGISGPGQYQGEAFEGGPVLPVDGGEVTLPKGQGVDLEMLYVLDPERFKESFPAMVTKEGEFNQTAFKRIQAAKEGIGAQPPAGRLARDVDFTDVAGFEQQLIQRIGFDPMTFNPMAEMESETSKNLPGLFRHIFQGQVSWNDRGSLTSEQNAYWIATKNAYRAQMLEKHKQAQKTAKWAYEQGMKKFHEEAGRALTRQKAARPATAKLPTLTEWNAERRNIEGDYKFKTLKDVILDPERTAIHNASKKVYDKLRGEKRFASPLETRMASVQHVKENINAYWQAMAGLNEKKDKDKIDFYQAEIKKRIGYVPQREVLKK